MGWLIDLAKSGIPEVTPKAGANPNLSGSLRQRFTPEGVPEIPSDPEVLGDPTEAEDLREFFEERSAILEYDAGLPRPEAELEAARITATLARNRGYLWVSLRAALAGYPVLVAQLPDKTGKVDALPFGVAKVAVLKDKRVVRQGEFTEAHEVKE